MAWVTKIVAYFGASSLNERRREVGNLTFSKVVRFC